MRLYCAGPMSGIAEFNFPAFAKRTAELRAQGHFVISPAEMDQDIGFDPIRDFNRAERPEFKESCLRRDVDAVIASDAIVLLEGYEHSRGAAFEIAASVFLGKHIYYPSDTVPEAIPEEVLA